MHLKLRYLILGFLITHKWKVQHKVARRQAFSGLKIFPSIHERIVGHSSMKTSAQISAKGSSGPKKMTSQAAIMAKSDAPQPILETIDSILPAPA
jgi:hypothetical protein